MISLRDVAQQVLSDELDGERVLALATKWTGEAALALAVRVSWEHFALADAVPLSAWACRYTLSKREQRFLAGYRSRRYAYKALDTVQAIRGVGPKMAFIRAVILPDSAWLAHHNQRRGGWLRRGAISAFRPRQWDIPGDTLFDTAFSKERS